MAEYRSGQAIDGIKASFEEERAGYIDRINKLKAEIQQLRNQQLKSSATKDDVAAARSAVNQKMSTLESQVQGLSQTVQGIDSQVNTRITKALQSSASRHRFHVGPEYNPPSQPEPVQEGGAFRVPPLALSVNGAVAIHNIGFTPERKNLVPLYYDAATERLTAFAPNK